ncbi:LacI family DNA-binding transcriptional regulator [Nonomuraea sp. NPDC049695]|uniref:LacI family DNA-binding transcriptional regulator n=1 Tax=Nonomuraea sp. NPDC049695 TaxID=3154734 RepID=UPI00343B9376
MPVKRITSSDVARAAGVSRATVSFVLNDKPGMRITEETRRRVLEAARDLDYRPHASARSLAAGRSDVVLLAIPDLPIGAGISRFVEELTTALAAYGLTLVTHLAAAHGRPLPDVCAAVDASVVVGFSSFDQHTVQALHRAGADLVLPSEAEGASPMRHVGRLQAEHLIGRGHQRLGYALPGHPAFRQMADERLRGATDACTKAGLEPPVPLTVHLETASAARAVTGWREQTVTGVCAFNDETAIALLAGLHEHGLAIPTDMAVVGADDIPTARLAVPPLTTVCYDLHGVARHRAETIVTSLAGAGETTHRTRSSADASTNPHVVQRSST